MALRHLDLQGSFRSFLLGRNLAGVAKGSSIIHKSSAPRLLALSLVLGGGRSESLAGMGAFLPQFTSQVPSGFFLYLPHGSEPEFSRSLRGSNTLNVLSPLTLHPLISGQLSLQRRLRRIPQPRPPEVSTLLQSLLLHPLCVPGGNAL